jgi:predicted nuclease of predicted toxin-antitoxin system
MKILLDECITKKLKRFLADHEVFTVTEMGWNGLKNGKLMAKCVENDFEILLTIDKNLTFQQNLKRYALAVVVLNSPSSKIEEIALYIPKFLEKIEEYEKENSYIIDIE